MGDSFESRDEISRVRQERSSCVDLEDCKIIEGNFVAVLCLGVAGEDGVDGCPKFRLSDVENVFDQSFDLLDVWHVFGGMAEEEL